MPDDVLDTAVESDVTQTSSSEPTSDTSTSGASTDATQSETPAADGTSSDVGAADAATQTDDGEQPSLTEGAEANAQPTKQSEPFEKRYNDLRGWASKVHQRNLNLEKQIQELQQQFQEIRQNQVQSPAGQPKTQPWDPEDPRHAEFLRYHDRADFYEELMEGETDPAEISKLQTKMQRVLGNEGIQMLRAWKADVRDQERERRLNPKAFYSKLVRQEAQPVVQQTLESTSQRYQQMVAARDEAQRWVRDNPEVATKENIQRVLDLMGKHSMPFDVAAMAVEREHYRKLVSDASKAKASAEEKERLLQGRAAGGINRNPNASKTVDVSRIRKEKGIQDGRQFTDLLFDLDKEGLL